MIGSQNSGMGTEIEGKGYGYYSMRDVNTNEQSSGNNWPLPSNREYADNGFSHRNVVEFDKNTLRQTMLEHEAIFKRHVAELHCLYKIQRDMMNEVRRKDVHRHGMMMIPLEAAPSSSSPFSAWNSPLSCTKGGDGLKECEILDHRPSKVRKRLFDLQFTPDEEGDCSYDASNRGGKLNLNADASKGFVFLADLNEPTQAEETESFSCQIETRSKSEFLRRSSRETSRRDAEDAIRSNGKRDWPYAEHYKHGLNSSSEQTMGFLQSEQRRELHGRKHNPFGVINNHKIDWSQTQPWGKSIQNPSTPFRTYSSLYSSRPMTSSQLCGQSHEMLGEKWRFQAGPSSNLCFSSPSANSHHSNGFYQGSSSGSKDAIACFPPVVGLDHMNAIDKGRKHDHHTHLPSWLKPNSDFKLKNPNSAETSFEPLSLLGNSTPPPRKILGFTISDYPPTSASLQPVTPICEYVKKDGKSRELIDINVAYYDSEAEESHKVRTHIDLNSCITEEEDPPMEPMKRNLLGPKFSMEIDLEAPPQPEEEEEEEEEEEVNAKIAAEAIVWISVSDPCPDEENSMEDPLGWFAEIVVPHSLFCEEITDHFEAITLSLPEMKPEEYMPKEEAIAVRSNLEEESGGMAVNKNQNRRSRRGRQKRDFQRDILPGLVSLSRHEVSEDIQTFSGMMKASGRTWQSGPTRGRRRRFVVEHDPAPRAEEEEANAGQSLLEVGGGSSLTVWGKTLRRPRRQRCPAMSNLNQNPNKKTITITSNSIISS